MRQPVHDAVVRFRASSRVIAAAEARAQQQGTSLSELMRNALRRELRDVA